MAATQQSVGHTSWGAKTLNLLASVKFAVTVVVIIALACVVGTLLPQGADVAAYLRQNPAAADRMELFSTLGLTHVYSSWWFLALLGVLAASVATCSMRRFLTVKRTTGFAQRRAFGSMLTHISILLILAGGVIRGIWGERGYLEFREGQTVARFQVEKGAKALPFALHLAKFEIETYADPEKTQTAKNESDCCDQLLVHWPEKNVTAMLATTLGVEQVVAPKGEVPAAENSFRIKVLKYIPDFVVDMATRQVSSRSSQPNNPAILVEVVGPNFKNNRWLFAKFPDFSMVTGENHGNGRGPLHMIYKNHGATQPRPAIDGPIKSFRSTLKVVENSQIVQEKTIEVNSPFKYKGYTFYQSGYNPRDLSYTSLQVVKDPGVPVVYAGFSLMIVGLFIVFYLNPWLEQRRVSKCPGAQAPEKETARARSHSGTQALGNFTS